MATKINQCWIRDHDPVNEESRRNGHPHEIYSAKSNVGTDRSSRSPPLGLALPDMRLFATTTIIEPVEKRSDGKIHRQARGNRAGYDAEEKHSKSGLTRADIDLKP